MLLKAHCSFIVINSSNSFAIFVMINKITFEILFSEVFNFQADYAFITNYCYFVNINK